MALTKKDVLQLVKENNVQFIRLQFTDIIGILKNVAIPADQLVKALDGELMFDGSSIEGFVRIEESDMYLRPDTDTFVILPWKAGEGAEARLICDVYNPDGTPFSGCPRNTLKKVIKEAREMGFSMNVGPELEFFLFHTDDDGKATLKTHDTAGYFDLAPVDRGEQARRDMVLSLKKIGFEIEASHHEVAPAQHEIDFKYDEALKTADKIGTFRYVVRTIAQSHGLHATFMPKPIYGIAGSGMHTNQSLFANGTNAFYDENDSLKLSAIAYHYMGGLIKHAKSFAAITNPAVNSYKRLVPGYEAPVYIAWSCQNRSPLIRVPAKRGPSTRLELRNPDPSCNPYLAIAVMLKAGLDGIRQGIKPPAPVNQNIYTMTEEEKNNLGIKSLPTTLYDAIQELKKNDVVKAALGEHITKRYIDAKELEWHKYNTSVHSWEVDSYLSLY